MQSKTSCSSSYSADEAISQSLENQEAETEDLQKQVRQLKRKADRLSKNNAGKDAVIANQDAKVRHLKDTLEQTYRQLLQKV